MEDLNREPLGSYKACEEKRANSSNFFVNLAHASSEGIQFLLFTQMVSLIPRWNDQNTPTHINSRYVT